MALPAPHCTALICHSIMIMKVTRRHTYAVSSVLLVSGYFHYDIESIETLTFLCKQATMSIVLLYLADFAIKAFIMVFVFLKRAACLQGSHHPTYSSTELICCARVERITRFTAYLKLHHHLPSTFS